MNCQNNKVRGLTFSTVNFNDETNELGQVEELCLDFILIVFLM